jgi:hypothetical protein
MRVFWRRNGEKQAEAAVKEDDERRISMLRIWEVETNGSRRWTSCSCRTRNQLLPATFPSRMFCASFREYMYVCMMRREGNLGSELRISLCCHQRTTYPSYQRTIVGRIFKVHINLSLKTLLLLLDILIQPHTPNNHTLTTTFLSKVSTSNPPCSPKLPGCQEDVNNSAILKTPRFLDYAACLQTQPHVRVQFSLSILWTLKNSPTLSTNWFPQSIDLFSSSFWRPSASFAFCLVVEPIHLLYNGAYLMPFKSHSFASYIVFMPLLAAI